MIFLITIWLKQISYLNVIFKSILASLGTFIRFQQWMPCTQNWKMIMFGLFCRFFFLFQIFCALFFYHLLGSRSSQRNRTRWEPCARKQICAWVVLTESYCQPFSLKIHFFCSLQIFSCKLIFFPWEMAKVFLQLCLVQAYQGFQLQSNKNNENSTDNDDNKI